MPDYKRCASNPQYLQLVAMVAFNRQTGDDEFQDSSRNVNSYETIHQCSCSGRIIQPGSIELSAIVPVPSRVLCE